MKYVVGFIFDTNRRKVLLISKKRPDWQKGKINGIGGVIREGETPAQAMQRKGQEEAGIDLDISMLPKKSAWRKFATFGNNEFSVECFRAFSDQIYLAETKTDERILTLTVDAALAHQELIPNIRWMLYLALDPDLNDAIIRYKDAPED